MGSAWSPNNHRCSTSIDKPGCGHRIFFEHIHSEYRELQCCQLPVALAWMFVDNLQLLRICSFNRRKFSTSLEDRTVGHRSGGISPMPRCRPYLADVVPSVSSERVLH